MIHICFCLFLNRIFWGFFSSWTNAILCGCVDQPGRLAGTECCGETPTNRGYGAHFIQGVLFNPRCALSVFSSLLPYSVFSVFCPRFFYCYSSGFSEGKRNKAGVAFGVRRLAARKYAAHVQWQQSKCSHFEVMNDNRSNNSSNIFLTLKCQHSINLIMPPGFL